MDFIEAIQTADELNWGEHQMHGPEIIFKRCPKCLGDTDDPSNQNKLSFNYPKEVFNCVRCGFKGHVSQVNNNQLPQPRIEPKENSAKDELDDKNLNDKNNSEYILSKCQSGTIDDMPLLQRYLILRGLPPVICGNIHFCSSLPYYENKNFVANFSAMVCSITNKDGEIIGVHRTYLADDGRKADVSCPKKVTGQTKDGFILLSNALKNVCAVTEGIETGLAVQDATGIPTVSAVSAGNMEKLELPDQIKTVHIFADLDKNSRGQVAAKILADKLTREGRIVFVHIPPSEMLNDEMKGLDYLNVYNKDPDIIKNQVKNAICYESSVQVVLEKQISCEKRDQIALIKLTPKWPDPLSEDCFIGITGEIVKLIEPTTESDPAALLFQFLTIVGNIFGRTVYFEVEQSRQHSNLFLTLVGKSSIARKGTSFNRIIALFDFNSEWKKKCIKSGISTGEGLIHAIRDKIEKIVRENNKQTGELETKCVVADEGVEDKRLLAVESEFSSVLKIISRDANTASNILRQLWDGNKAQNLTKNSPESVEKPHVSLIGHITTAELNRFLNETEMFNGFGNRFLWIVVQRSKELPLGGKPDRTEENKLKNRLQEIILNVHKYNEISFDPEAEKIWVNGMYSDLTQERDGQLLAAMTSRGATQVLRIATIYAVLDKSYFIKKEHLKAARAVWEYSFQSCEYLFSKHLENPTANKILKALSCAPNGLTRTELRSLFSGHKSKNIMDEALEQLSQRNLAYCKKEKSGDSDTFGRDIEKWFIVQNN